RGQAISIVNGGAAGRVSGVRFGSKRRAGQRGMVVVFDAKLDVARVVAGQPQVMIGYAEIHESPAGPHRATQIAGRTDIVLVSDCLVAVVENDQVEVRVVANVRI